MQVARLWTEYVCTFPRVIYAPWYATLGPMTWRWHCRWTVDISARTGWIIFFFSDDYFCKNISASSPSHLKAKEYFMKDYVRHCGRKMVSSGGVALWNQIWRHQQGAVLVHGDYTCTPSEVHRSILKIFQHVYFSLWHAYQKQKHCFTSHTVTTWQFRLIW